MQIIYSTLIRELHQYAKNNQQQRAVIGLSGGLDSAVALCIAVRAFGPQNVTALILPEVGLTSNEDIEHAKILTAHLGAMSHYQPINNFLVDYSFVTWDKTEQSNENLKIRVRSTLLHHYAEATNSLLIGTANKSDLALGYGGIQGEFTAHFHILGDLYKSEVLRLAQFIGLPAQLIDKPASLCLKPHRTDEDTLGSPWIKIDDIIDQMKQGVDPEVLIQKGMNSLTVHKINRMMQQNEEHTKKLPFIQVGQISESILKAQAAEASSL
jgi:NAD+ synthetase